jgi:hypothetical protein
MRTIILSSLLLLAGCSTLVPVERKFPDAAPALTETCASLQTVEGNNVAITDMLKVVITNYTMYYECAAKVDGWNNWYTEQKKLFESVK